VTHGAANCVSGGNREERKRLLVGGGPLKRYFSRIMEAVVKG